MGSPCVFFGINKVPVAEGAPRCGLHKSKKPDVLLSLAVSCSPHILQFQDETLKHHPRFSPPSTVALAFSIDKRAKKKKQTQN